MSPRHNPDSDPGEHHTGIKKSPDKLRKEEEDQHHTYDHLHPHPEHHPQKNPDLPPVHTPHSHPHGDELGPHTNQPGPIKPEKKITKTGTKK